LSREELGLRLATSELPIRQQQSRIGDPSRPRSFARIFRRARSAQQRTTGLLERAFGVLGVVARLEVGQSVFELRGRRIGTDHIGQAGRHGKADDEPEKKETGAQ